MTTQMNLEGNGRAASLGALAGGVSTIVFTIVHDLLISNIWFMLLPMLVAGALCGALLSWSYGLLVAAPSGRSWLAYNLIHLGLLILLGLVSLLLLEPVTTMAALAASGEMPGDLFGQALPMTAVYTVLMAGLITMGYGYSWKKFGAVLLTSVTLVLLLGHNVFILGLIDIPRGSFYLVGKMFGLIILLDGVYMVVFALLAWRRPTAVTGQISTNLKADYPEF